MQRTLWLTAVLTVTLALCAPVWSEGKHGRKDDDSDKSARQEQKQEKHQEAKQERQAPPPQAQPQPQSRPSQAWSQQGGGGGGHKAPGGSLQAPGGSQQAPGGGWGGGWTNPTPKTDRGGWGGGWTNPAPSSGGGQSQTPNTWSWGGGSRSDTPRADKPQTGWGWGGGNDGNRGNGKGNGSDRPTPPTLGAPWTTPAPRQDNNTPRGDRTGGWNTSGGNAAGQQPDRKADPGGWGQGQRDGQPNPGVVITPGGKVGGGTHGWNQGGSDGRTGKHPNGGAWDERIPDGRPDRDDRDGRDGWNRGGDDRDGRDGRGGDDRDGRDGRGDGWNRGGDDRDGRDGRDGWGDRDRDHRGWDGDHRWRDRDDHRWDYHTWRPYRPDFCYRPYYPYRYHRSPVVDFRLFVDLFSDDDPRVHRTADISEYDLANAEIWAADGTFLGLIAPGHVTSDSIFNRAGAHGDRWSPRSIWNHEGQYGSYYSALSVWDPDTWTPPRLYKDGRFLGYLTTNKDMYPRVGPIWIAKWIVPDYWEDYR